MESAPSAPNQEVGQELSHGAQTPGSTGQVKCSRRLRGITLIATFDRVACIEHLLYQRRSFHSDRYGLSVPMVVSAPWPG